MGRRGAVTPADLLTRVLLPGGLVATNSSSTRYAMSLMLPRSLANHSGECTIVLDLQWGSMDGSNPIVTSVLGETFTKGGTDTGGKTTSVLDELTKLGALPFTGGYIGVELLVGVVLVLTGAALSLVNSCRPRRAPDMIHP